MTDYSPALCVLLFALACDRPVEAPLLDLPERPADALGASEIAHELRGLDLDAREARVYVEIARGNVPSWLRRLEPVRMMRRAGGRLRRITLWVTPDYLALGSDADAMLIPLSPQTAQRVADRVGASLPTPAIVDAIWAAARNKLVPIRLARDDSTRTVYYFERHDRLIHAQRMLHDAPPGAFVAGHKLDVVLSPALAGRRGRVAVYGWHLPDGQPIQELSTALPDRRVGYSHGIRLVHRDVLVDGVRRDLLDVLRDPVLAPVLSEDGAIAEPQYPLDRGH